MTKQPEPVRDMVRLTRFWYKSTCIGELISGAKYAMEIVAIRSCQYVNHSQDHFYLDAFKKFLEYIADFENIDINFICIFFFKILYKMCTKIYEEIYCEYMLYDMAHGLLPFPMMFIYGK